jgi:hypothetical protein
MQLTNKLQASFGRFKHLVCRKTQLLSVALVVLFCNSAPLTWPSHLTSLLGRDMNLHPFRKEMSSFCFRLDFLIPSNAYSDRSFCLSLAESNHAWLGIGYPPSFYPRGMTVCARWSKNYLAVLILLAAEGYQACRTHLQASYPKKHGLTQPLGRSNNYFIQTKWASISFSHENMVI